MDEEELRSLCRLARAPGARASTLLSATALAGSIPRWVSLPVRDLAALGFTAGQAHALHAVEPATLEADLATVRKLKLHVISARSALYPARLLQIPDAPAVLFVRGDPAALATPQIALVGSRNPTALGHGTARDFACFFGQCGLTITSGLAVGIDAASHEGALAAGALTVAVCGTGLDVTYPRPHTALAARIAAQGALVSEFPPGTPPLAHHFPQRNRLISGLSLGVLVIEAARRSGSLATARCAGDQGREVFAVPGSIHNPLSRGCHELIRQGATLVECADDVLRELHFYQSKQTLDDALPAADRTPARPGQLDKPAEILLDALGFEPTSVDALIARTGFSSELLASLLLEGELDGRIAPEAGGRYRRVP